MSQWINYPESIENKLGFVYLVVNNHPDSLKKYYIGCKKFLKKTKLKPTKTRKRNKIVYKDNDVEKYWGSSKELLSDIEKYGIENFKKYVIELCDSQWHMKYAELKWQLEFDVLMDNKSYNSIINIRLNTPPKSYLDIERNRDKLLKELNLSW